MMPPNSRPSASRLSQVTPSWITLDRAFSWILYCFEERAAVPISERLGLLPSHYRDYPYPCGGGEATGPEYLRHHTPVRVARLRGRSDQGLSASAPEPKPRVAVPAIPWEDQLRHLLIDNRQNFDLTSPAERRICEVHGWLSQLVRAKKVEIWADVVILPERGGPSLQLGWAQLWAASWGAITINYAESSCSSNEMHDETVDGISIRGSLLFEKVTLDANQLEFYLSEFLAAPKNELDFSISIDTDDVCQVVWNGQAATPFSVRNNERQKRGLMGLQILLRHRNQRIACHLISYLEHRPVNTKKLSPEDFEKVQLMVKKIQRPARALYEQKISLKEAHDQLLDVLCEPGCETSKLRFAAPWSTDFVEKSSKSFGPSDDYRRASEDARTSIRIAIDLIEKVTHANFKARLEPLIIYEMHDIHLKP